MINTRNDRVEVYADAEGMWRWRRIDGDNGKIVSVSGEGYTDRGYCIDAAMAYNRLPGSRTNVRWDQFLSVEGDR
jgi:uncharacterized protein YegP (UPF0339 family)